MVRNGSHYEPTMSTAAERVSLLSNHMQQLADEYMNPDTDPSVNELEIFCEINALARLPRLRQHAPNGDIIRMRYIFHMRPGE